MLIEAYRTRFGEAVDVSATEQEAVRCSWVDCNSQHCTVLVVILSRALFLAETYLLWIGLSCIWALIPRDDVQRRRELLEHLLSTGTEHALKEKLKRTIARIARDVCALPPPPYTHTHTHLLVAVHPSMRVCAADRGW